MGRMDRDRDVDRCIAITSLSSGVRGSVVRGRGSRGRRSLGRGVVASVEARVPGRSLRSRAFPCVPVRFRAFPCV
jgi:hypothetical protein